LLSHLVLDTLNHDTQRVVHVALAVKRGSLAEKLDERLDRLLEVRHKVRDLELPKVDALLDRDGGSEVDGHVRSLATLGQEVDEKLPHDRELGALLVRADPLSDKPRDTALENAVTVC